MIEYGVMAKRNHHLEDLGSTKEDEMRGSNSILRMSHLLHPGAGNKNQVKRNKKELFELQNKEFIASKFNTNSFKSTWLTSTSR